MQLIDNQLETKNFKENQNTLGNAGIGDKGAVPEPHEWALLAIIARLPFSPHLSYRVII